MPIVFTMNSLGFEEALVVLGVLWETGEPFELTNDDWYHHRYVRSPDRVVGVFLDICQNEVGCSVDNPYEMV